MVQRAALDANSSYSAYNLYRNSLRTSRVKYDLASQSDAHSSIHLTSKMDRTSKDISEVFVLHIRQIQESLRTKSNRV